MKHVVSLHLGGTAGDMLSSFWINSKHFYSAVQEHTLTSSGRMVPTWNQKFLDQFPKQKNLHYYNRDWSNDLDTLNQLDYPVFINTTRPDQAELIKNYFGDRVHIVVINYNQNLWPLVVKNFCTKVLDSEGYLTNDDVGSSFLDGITYDPVKRKYFLELGKTGKLGYWYADNLIKGYGNMNYPPTEFLYQGDTQIMLDEILMGEPVFNILKSTADRLGFDINLDNFKTIYENWYQNQDQIYFYSYNNKDFNQCLGYNSLAISTANSPISLSPIDQLFIQNYTKTTCCFNTTEELIQFFQS